MPLLLPREFFSTQVQTVILVFHGAQSPGRAQSTLTLQNRKNQFGTVPSQGLVTLLVLKTSVCALLIKGEHFLQHSVAQPVLLRHADAIEDPQYHHCQNITNTYKYRLYRLPEHQSSLLWKRNDGCLKNKSRRYVLKDGPAGSHRAAVMKVELLCNNL